MAAEDHLGFVNQQVGVVEGLLVLVCTQELPFIQFFQAHQEVTESGQEELAAVHPVKITLTLPFNRRTYGPVSHSISLHSLKYTRKITSAPIPIMVLNENLPL